ncbi:hypothetical protein HYE82_20255 [Streptomyces sp. BR123]|uniref:hypothetical protein n=1 Tax=Streptomyces sp. BR123 TaxID=2749828 RepID=UPI0015C41CFE|nr:hypothetical protein [Streptomyces sp. BR123]NXY96673.1 hypothetical protein [Streptomyces sp. BR123]
MLDEATVALAASVGSGIVQAAGTDVWGVFRNRLARLLGRGNRQQETAQRERLDRTAAELAAAVRDGAGPADGAAGQPSRHGAAWRARIEDLLEQLEPDERVAVAAGLRALLDEVAPESVRPAAGGVEGNVFLGPTAVQSGDGNVQVNRFGSRP